MKRRLMTVMKVVGAVIVVCGVLYGVLLGLAQGALRRAYAALEAEGRPMTAEAVIPPPIPDRDNAALDYADAVRRLRAVKVGNDDLFSRLSGLASRITTTTTTNTGANAEFRELIRSPAAVEALARIEQGVQKPSCQYALDYSKGPYLLLPHIAELRSLTRILGAVVRLQIADSNHVAAWQTAVTSLSLANALEQEPLIISQLVRAAQLAVSAATIRDLAAHALPAHEQYDVIQQSIMRFENSASLVRAMDADRLLMGEWVFRQARAEFWRGGPNGITKQKLLLWFACRLPAVRIRDHAAYVTVMGGYARNAAEPFSPSDNTLGDEVLGEVPGYCVVTRLLTPVLSRVKVAQVAKIASARVTRAGLAALRYRETHGCYPARLSELGVAGLEDPFTGKALIYRASPDGFVVYSVGRDLVDDDGLDSPDDPSAGDIVWRYGRQADPAPEQPRQGR